MTARVDDLRERLAKLSPAALAAVRDRLAGEVQQRRYDLWQPYPWQRCPGEVPPMGAWVLGGGRGVGKTDAGARYILDHVNGPPCDPRIPGGHRISIIAPTLGDAVESAIMGPSGLKTHDPRVRLTAGHGGTHVAFPNGSRAKVFGAHTSNDIERLRSGGNRSIAEGTLIRTGRGLVPIQSVTTDDLVLTRAGLRPVLGVWNHGTRLTLRLTTRSGASVELTPDHEVWSGGRWLRADQITTGGSVSLWQRSDGAATHGPFASPDTTREALSQQDRYCYTEPFTNCTMDPSQTGTRSTTRTMTSPITTRPTLSQLPRQRTGLSITNSVDPHGIPWVASDPRKTPSQLAHVSNAANLSRATGPHGSAPNAAGVLSYGMLPGSCEHASCVAEISRASLPQQPARVDDRVQIVSSGSDAAPVWDLTVAGEHEFFAGDILVANCTVWLEEAAAMRYLAEVITHSKMGLRIGPRPHYVITTTPKPRAEIVRLWADPKTLLTKGRTMDAYHLPPETRQALWEEYGGTALGRQELEGEILSEMAGALVSRETIDASRVPEPPEMNLIVVGMDPNGTGTGDECGIVGMGRGVDGHAYVLADASTKSTGRDAAMRAWALFDDLQADVLVVEKNFGQSWLRDVLADAWKENHADDPMPLKLVNAGSGKALRAQPMAMRFEQDRAHIVGTLDKFETQLATWVPTESPESPDRVDAAAHAFAFLRGREKQRATVSLPTNLGPMR